MNEINKKIDRIERLMFKLEKEKEKLIKRKWDEIIKFLREKKEEGWKLFIFKSLDKNREAREQQIVKFYIIEPGLYYKYVHPFLYANFWHMSIGGQYDLIEKSEDYIRFNNLFWGGDSKFFCGINYYLLEPYELREVYPEIFEKYF